MAHMIAALARSVAQLSDPAFRRVLLRSILGAAAGFLALAAVVWAALFQTDLIAWGWLDVAVDVAGGLAVFVLAYLLFPPVVAAIAGFFLEDVANAVEARHYPGLPEARHQPLGEVMLTAARFFAVVAFLNLLVLPLWFVPGLNLIVYYALNGYLLGREYFELVGLRRMSRPEIRRRFRQNAPYLWATGAVIAFFSTIPLVNLLVPILGTAFMTHIFYLIERKSR